MIVVTGSDNEETGTYSGAYIVVWTQRKHNLRVYVAALKTIVLHIIDCSKDGCEHLVHG